MMWVRTYALAAKPSTKIASTLLLLRNPVISADIPAFESQYYKYQKELWKRLMWTFPKWFYFREGTLAAQKFKELNRDPVDNNPNIEYPRGRPEIRQNRDRRFKQELKLPKTYVEGETAEPAADASNDLSRKIVPNSRVTKADEANDQTSLERQLARSLYLVVGDGKSWDFPNFPQPETPTALDEVAEAGLYKIGGDRINYFNVSNTPCHVETKDDAKHYFIKSHIVLGEFVPQDGIKYLWLTKDELKDKIPRYDDVAHLLNDV
ncbi:hypothetical protein JNB11_04685 [Kocuria palustris]|nr:hypothetical protein [Kocuria palustris]